MIVTCAKCATQFQLDLARVPEAGIRVRCSVCKHAFFVEHPDDLGEAFDPLEQVVEQVLDADARGAPEPSRDLGAQEEPLAPEAGPRDEAPEGSWEFSDGGRLSEAASRGAHDRFEESFEAAREAVDDLLGSTAPDLTPPRSSRAEVEERPGLDPAPTAAEDAAEGPEDAAEGSEDPGLAPGGEGPELPLADDPWETPAWTGADAGAADPGFESDSALDLALDSEAGDEIEIDGDEEPPLASAPDADPFEDELAGSGIAPEPAEGPGLGRERDGDFERFAPEPRAAAPLARSAPIAGEPFPLGLAAPLELEPRRSRVLAFLTRAGNGLGSGVVAVLAAVALWGSVAPRSVPAASPGSQAVAGLEAMGVAGRWVEHATLGPLYVVSGELHNAAAEPRAPGARLALRLLDAEGAPIAVATASLAPPVGSRWLREADPRELRAAREAGASELARKALAPGARVAFEAVVEAMPDAARRFDLVAVPAGAPAPSGS